MTERFCRSCGAPEAESKDGACSYCKTPTPPRFRALFGYAVVRPEWAWDARLRVYRSPDGSVHTCPDSV